MYPYSTFLHALKSSVLPGSAFKTEASAYAHQGALDVSTKAHDALGWGLAAGNSAVVWLASYSGGLQPLQHAFTGIDHKALPKPEEWSEPQAVLPVMEHEAESQPAEQAELRPPSPLDQHEAAVEPAEDWVPHSTPSPVQREAEADGQREKTPTPPRTRATRASSRGVVRRAASVAVATVSRVTRASGGSPPEAGEEATSGVPPSTGQPAINERAAQNDGLQGTPATRGRTNLPTSAQALVQQPDEATPASEQRGRRRSTRLPTQAGSSVGVSTRSRR
ncbi:hypothetical protein WJX73_003310 [Symbiochloris irregularis]|uniref:Uncharacterized protein n=1 Tax=Symbiochloris irregularis TaxID=706552 RepID=A0AAW1PTC3_9CHLO